MKSWILCIAAAAAWAQAPAQPSPQNSAQPPLAPDTVIATVDGKDLTYAEMRKIIDASPPPFVQYFKQNPADAIQRVYLFRYLTDEANKLKLAEQSPWKEQIESQTSNILGNAMLTHWLNSYPVPEDAAEAYYTTNKSRFEQVKIKIVKIGFKPDSAAASGTSDEALADAARRTLEAAHNPNRAEADAKKLAGDLVKKLRAGADFAKIAAEYSEDQESKTAGGVFGAVRATSPYPDPLKSAALSMRPGDVSEPVKISVAFYILGCDERSVQPLQEVHDQVLRDLRQQHVDQMLKALEKRFTPAIVKPEAILQLGK